MKSVLALAFVVGSASAVAQQTGVAHPPDVVIEDTTAAPVTIVVEPKPSAAIPMRAPGDAEEAAPARQTERGPAPVSRPATPVYQSPAVTLKQRDVASFDPDANIVTEVETNAHELPTGTLMRMRLRGEINTASTAQDTPFTGEISDNIEHRGRVVIPAGSVLHGRITEIRGGRRIAGAAMIHLEPQSVTLPDGTQYAIHAAVVDTDQDGSLRISSEGTLVRREHAKENIAAVSLATGGAAAAGAVIGGGVGALVGAGVGAGVGTIVWLKQDVQTHLPADSLLVFSLVAPMEIQPLVREPNYARANDAPAEDAVQQVRPVRPAPVQSSTAPQSFVPTN